MTISSRILSTLVAAAAAPSASLAAASSSSSSLCSTCSRVSSSSSSVRRRIPVAAKCNITKMRVQTTAAATTAAAAVPTTQIRTRTSRTRRMRTMMITRNTASSSSSSSNRNVCVVATTGGATVTSRPQSQFSRSKALPSKPQLSSRLFSHSSSSDCNDSNSDDNNNNNDFYYRWPSLYDEVRDMMMASYISYPLSFLIREAKLGNLKDSHQVLQTLHAIRDGDLDTVLCPRDIKRIVMDNKDYISCHPQNNLRDEYGWYTVLKIWQEIDEQHQQHQHQQHQQHQHYNNDDGGGGGLKLLEFDDHNDSHRLVYGIAVNEARKRLTVIFRGTYADGTDDWKRNLEFDQIELPLPYNLRKIQERQEQQIDNDGYINTKNNHDELLLPESIRVHQGMYNYLFNNVERDTMKYQKERYEEIVDQIQECIGRYPGFKIYVTGHSAGGALAELFSFYLATSRLRQLPVQNISIPKPVTCVSFGSLCLGDIGFQRAYQRAEQLGWLRHVRVISQGDPICYMPPLANYMPAGMHLQLHRGSGFSLWRPDGPGNNTWSSLIQMLRFSITQRSDLFNEHSIPSYLRRLEREKEALSLVRLNDLYRHANCIPAEESLSLY